MGMTHQPATEKQIEYLTALSGETPPKGLSKAEASRQIDWCKKNPSVRIDNPETGRPELVYPKDFPARIAALESMDTWNRDHIDQWAKMVFNERLPANPKEWIPGHGGEVVKSIHSIIESYTCEHWRTTPDGPQPLTIKRRQAATWRPADLITWARENYGDALDD